MALRTFFISFHDQLPDAPLQPRQHMIALAAVSCERMSGGLVDRHLFVTALVPWKRIGLKKDPHCDLKGHANHRTPQTGVVDHGG
jgi:hypothetical protein